MFAGALQTPELLQIGFQHFLGEPTELSQDKELQLLRHFRELSGARGIKNDLKRTHRFYHKGKPDRGKAFFIEILQALTSTYPEKFKGIRKILLTNNMGSRAVLQFGRAVTSGYLQARSLRQLTIHGMSLKE